MRLTVQVVNDAPLIKTPLGLNMMQLRGHQALLIENLNITNNSFEVIDLVDNQISVVKNIPSLPKLKGILLSNNMIVNIQQNLHNSVPNLEWIALTNNEITTFAALKGLQGLQRLREICLIGNDITKLEHYRLFIIWLLPSLKIVDFEKVKEIERAKGKELYGANFQQRTKLADEILDGQSNVYERTDLVRIDKSKMNKKPRFTKEAREELMNRLQNAKSMEEIEEIENLLQS